MTLSAFLDAVFDIYMEETHQIKHILKVAPALTFHSINKNEIKHFQKNDGNALGIEGDEGPLISEYHPTTPHSLYTLSNSPRHFIHEQKLIIIPHNSNPNNNIVSPCCSHCRC